MTTPGNTALRAARQALGYRSQAALADALNEMARTIGLRISVSPRTVRRWESDESPWPHPEHAAALEALFNRPISELGFTPPWAENSTAPAASADEDNPRSPVPKQFGPTATPLPPIAANDFMAITVAHRRLYWCVPGTQLHRAAAEHADMGMGLLHHAVGSSKEALAKAVSESCLLAGRIEFFDLQRPEPAQAHLVNALQAAHEAGDALLGGAALAHMAFIPAFSANAARVEEARDRLRAARTFARRGQANAEYVAWLDAVEAEAETRFGNTRRALSLIHDAEERYRTYDSDQTPSPVWLDWFSPARLAGFKGNTLLTAGRGREARETLETALANLPAESAKQRSVYLADLASAAIVEQNPDRACAYAEQALDALGQHWYATAMDRIKSVRQALHQWDSLPAVRQLDDRLYDWHTTVNSLSR